jgi:hypothetical protein
VQATSDAEGVFSSGVTRQGNEAQKLLRQIAREECRREAHSDRKSQFVAAMVSIRGCVVRRREEVDRIRLYPLSSRPAIEGE